MDYTSDSDLSDDTRELVSKGLAIVKCKRRMTMEQTDGVQERFLESNMDTSNVRHPLRRGVSIGDTSNYMALLQRVLKLLTARITTGLLGL